MYNKTKIVIPDPAITFEIEEEDIKIQKVKLPLRHWSNRIAFIFASTIEVNDIIFDCSELSFKNKNLRQMYLDRNSMDSIKTIDIHFIEPGSRVICLDNKQYMIDKSSFILVDFKKHEIKVVYKLKNLLTEEIDEKDYFDSDFLKIF